MVKLNSMNQVMDAILQNKLEYGNNKEYYLVLDEDDNMALLKRDRFDVAPWPMNISDGEEIWACYLQGGHHMTTEFLDYLGIDYLS